MKKSVHIYTFKRLITVLTLCELPIQSSEVYVPYIHDFTSCCPQFTMVWSLRFIFWGKNCFWKYFQLIFCSFLFWTAFCGRYLWFVPQPIYMNITSPIRCRYYGLWYLLQSPCKLSLTRLLHYWSRVYDYDCPITSAECINNVIRSQLYLDPKTRVEVFEWGGGCCSVARYWRVLPYQMFLQPSLSVIILTLFCNPSLFSL